MTLDRLRLLISPEKRGYIHALAVAILGYIALTGNLTDSTSTLIVALVVAGFDLALALLHSTSTVRTALYGLALAAQPVALAFHFGNDAQWTGGVAILAAVLGGAVAAAKTPAPEVPYGDHARLDG